MFPKLEVLELSSISSNKLWDGQVSGKLSWVRNLTTLIVDACDGLTFLAPSSVAINFVHLRKLEIRRCQNMVEIISTDNDKDAMFPVLQILLLRALPNLEKFCTSTSSIEFSCLQDLFIIDCIKLGSFVVDRTMSKDATIGHHLFDKMVSTRGRY